MDNSREVGGRKIKYARAVWIFGGAGAEDGRTGRRMAGGILRVVGGILRVVGGILRVVGDVLRVVGGIS